MSVGSFVFVLHGHLPYVLNHGRWPHGEAWLFEAAAETWLPLLDCMHSVLQAGGRPAVSLGLTPVLLEQLGHDRFKQAFPVWLQERADRAARDQVEFAARGDSQLAVQAQRWQEHFVDLQARFHAIDGDLPGAFAALWNQGAIELISSCATHGYLPLIHDDASARAQIRTGLDTSERHLGRRPTGFWMPECAYRPRGPWSSPVLPEGKTTRMGVEELLAEQGVEWVTVDAALYQGARSEGISGPEGYRKVGWDQASWDTTRSWRSVLEPHRIGTEGRDSGVTALARHPQVSEQVWSSKVGYPGDGSYLEFHKKHGMDGHRYWRVTSPTADLGDKERYDPHAVEGTLFAQAQHFCALVRSILTRHHQETGRHGVVVAPFDAELFGHWWHEGPKWLRNVLLTLSADPHVDLCTAQEVLRDHPADKVAWLPEGSWGEGSDHRVWLNDPLKWTWQVAHRAEGRLRQLLAAIPWRDEPPLQEALILAARELLLLQASDWQFVIHTQGAPDYGTKRFCGHASRFDRMCDLAWHRHQGLPADPALDAAMAEARAADDVFPDVDLELWCG